MTVNTTRFRHCQLTNTFPDVYFVLQCPDPVCGPGKYSATGTNCLDCPVGSHSQSGSSVITDCKCTAGMSGPDGGQCEPCPVGTFSTNKTNGNTSCTPCAIGWTTAGEGSTMCTIYSSCDHTTNTIYINTTVEVEKIVEVRITLLPLPKISTPL